MTRFEHRKPEDRHCGHHGRHGGMRHRAMHMRTGHRHGGGRGRGRGRRALKHGDLRYLLMQLISEEPRHGYDLIKAIEAKSAGAYAPSPGVVYPALDVMQDLGWVRVETGEGRKTFHATPEGAAALAEAGDAIEAIEARLTGLAEGGEEMQGPGEVRMALRKLHHGVRQKMLHPDASEVTRRQIADILANALQKVEAL